jgi:sialic acid synthase SpsE
LQVEKWQDFRLLVIAEIGINHEGSYKLLKQMDAREQEQKL